MFGYFFDILILISMRLFYSLCDSAVECAVCFDEIAVKKMIPAPCRHLFCSECWKGYLESKVNSLSELLMDHFSCKSK